VPFTGKEDYVQVHLRMLNGGRTSDGQQATFNLHSGRFPFCAFSTIVGLGGRAPTDERGSGHRQIQLQFHRYTTHRIIMNVHLDVCHAFIRVLPSRHLSRVTYYAPLRAHCDSAALHDGYYTTRVDTHPPHLLLLRALAKNTCQLLHCSAAGR